MSDSFQFPKNPLEGTQNRFVDERGENPFAELSIEPQQVETAGANPNNLYATGAVETAGGERADFELTLKHQGPLLSVLSGGAFLFSIVTAVMLQFYGTAIIFALAAIVGALVLTIKSASDLSAMRAGAMTNEGRKSTLTALVLSILAGVVVVIGLAIFIIQIFV